MHSLMKVLWRKSGSSWPWDLKLPVQSMSITTKVMSSNPACGEVYLIQHYVIKFISDFRHWWFSSGTTVSSTNKTDCNDIAEILLKVALNTITLTCIEKRLKKSSA